MVRTLIIALAALALPTTAVADADFGTRNDSVIPVTWIPKEVPSPRWAPVPLTPPKAEPRQPKREIEI